MNKLKIFIADNQALTKAGIITILSEYYGSYLDILSIDNKANLSAQLLTMQPHILIIDFNIFDFNVISELSEIKKISPDTGVLVISDNQSPDDILKVLDCGITNYISKTSDKQELIEAVNATINNRKYFSSEILEVLLNCKVDNRSYQSHNAHITPAEKEIIKLITQGLTTKEIAAKKMLSYHTIITHRKNIFRKLAINNCSELMLYAFQTGIAETSDYSI
jgi:DNA-binding NarL/FixJ family response regulator